MAKLNLGFTARGVGMDEATLPVEDVGRTALAAALAALQGVAGGDEAAAHVRRALDSGVAPERPMLACKSCKGSGVWDDRAFQTLVGRQPPEDEEPKRCPFCKGKGEVRAFWPRVVRSWSHEKGNAGTGPIVAGWQGTGYVKIRPCDKELGGKTYLGYLLGDVPLSVSVSVDDAGHMVVTRTHHNPAILVFALGKVVYGIESWWGMIEGPEDLKDISEEDIESTWYVAALRTMTGEAAAPADAEGTD